MTSLPSVALPVLLPVFRKQSRIAVGSPRGVEASCACCVQTPPQCLRHREIPSLTVTDVRRALPPIQIGIGGRANDGNSSNALFYLNAPRSVGLIISHGHPKNHDSATWSAATSTLAIISRISAGAFPSLSFASQLFK